VVGDGAGLCRHSLIVGAIVAVVVAVGAPMRATYGARTTADEPHYLLTAISLWEDQDLDVRDERGEGRYLDFHEVMLPLQAEVQDSGRQVAPHDPLLPAVLAPAAGLGGWLGAKLFLAGLAGGLAALTTVVAIRRFGVGGRLAATVAVVAGVSPPLAIYGTQVYPELPAALLALAGFWWVTSPPSIGDQGLRTRNAVAVVATVVALPWLSVKYAPVAAVLAVGLLWRLGAAGRRRRLAWAGAGLLAAGAMFLLLHRWWYGGWTAYASGSHFKDGEFTVVGDPNYAGRTRRLVGLLVDRHFGLAVWQPAALAIVPALAALLRRRPPGTVLLAAMIVAGWLNATFVALTMHGWWWPGRQVVVVLPLAVVAIAWWVQRLSAPGRVIVGAIAGFGVLAYGLLLAGVLGGRHTLIVDFSRTVDPFVRLVRPVLPDGTAPLAGSNAWWTAAWIVVMVGAAVVSWRAASGHERRRRQARSGGLRSDDPVQVGVQREAEHIAAPSGVGKRLIGLASRPSGDDEPGVPESGPHGSHQLTERS
jgi:hypothetical protein